MGREAWHHLYNLRAWVALREAQLSAEPLCRYCLERGETVLATVADHIEAHKGDIRLFLNGKNLQSLCDLCHSGAKQREEKRGYAIGCDGNGNPVGESHHWNERAQQ